MAITKCKCGNTYFARVNINQFKDNAATLHSSLHEVEPDHDIKLYQCIACKDYMMPAVSYFSSTEDDKDLYRILEGALKGEILEKKTKFNGRRIHPGTVAFVGGEDKPEENGKFIPVE